MDELIETPALETAQLETTGALLSLRPAVRMTLVMPFAGAKVPGFPAPGKVSRDLIWWGRAQAMLVGRNPPKSWHEKAAIIDQSDSWVHQHLSGDATPDVLARLCPADLRAGRNEAPLVVRSLLHHIGAVFVRRPDDVDVFVPRSYAAST